MNIHPGQHAGSDRDHQSIEQRGGVTPPDRAGESSNPAA
jgi:hypothetical protein